VLSSFEIDDPVATFVAAPTVPSCNPAIRITATRFLERRQKRFFGLACGHVVEHVDRTLPLPGGDWFEVSNWHGSS